MRENGLRGNVCAPDDLLDGCYNLIVDYPNDPSSSPEISWQIQNAEFSVFALTGAAGFDQTGSVRAMKEKKVLIFMT